MKKTNFCFSFPMGNLQTNIKEPGVLIYNAFTNALAAIETSKYQAYSDFCAKGTEIADQQLIADLKKGGEPLLAVDTIDKLSTEFQSICKENHIQYFAGIITNGSLLTREIVKRLNELDVNFYQITVDGSKATHNQRRPLKGGGETYDLILKKIEECYDLLPTMTSNSKRSISSSTNAHSP